MCYFSKYTHSLGNCCSILMSYGDTADFIAGMRLIFKPNLIFHCVR